MGQTDVVRKYEPPVITDYGAARAAFRWEKVLADLGAPADKLNLGALATEHQVARGRGLDQALFWTGAQGHVERLSYAELTDWTGKIANMLDGYGVEAGDRVVFLLPAIPELYAGVLATMRLGAIPCVLGSGRNLDYLRNVLTGTRPRVFVTAPIFRQAVASVRPLVPELRYVFIVTRPRAMVGALDEGEVNWSGAFDAASANFSARPAASDDRAFIQYPDVGTTGSVVSHRLALPLHATATSVLEMRPGESTMSIFVPGDPLFVPYGILAPFLVGSTVVTLEDPARFARFGELSVQNELCTWFSSFRAIDVMLRLDPTLGVLLKRCRNIACTWPYDKFFVEMTMMSYASPVHPVWTDREFGAIQTAELRGTPLRTGSVGRAVPGAELRVVDAAGNPMDVGSTGRLAVKLGPAAPFTEYWQDPESTAKHVRDGWYVTPRTARIDADGYVWIEA